MQRFKTAPGYFLGSSLLILLTIGNVEQVVELGSYRMQVTCRSLIKIRSICQIDMIYLLTAIGLSPGCSSTVHIYTQTIHRTKQNKQYIEQHNNLGECGPCPVLARFTLAFALQLRKKHGKTSVRVAASKNTVKRL